jgi:serine/threonine protein kinase
MEAKINLCSKCGNNISFSQDSFIPAICNSCGMQQILQFNKEDLHFERLVAASPIFYIYKGYDIKHKVFLFITILRKEINEYEWNLNIAKEQAEKLTSLSHTNICPLFAHGMLDDYYYIAYPRMDGYKLSSYDPVSHGLMDINKTAELLQAAALGMAVAHFNEFTHHNICPENLHIDARGTLRINDFFLSRFIYAYDQRRMKLENKIFFSVSPHYISPEKAESGLEDHRGDIFSFGVIMYFFLTGQYPFQGTEAIETIYTRIKHTTKKTDSLFKNNNFPEYAPPVIPKELRKEIPDELSKLIMQMLSYYPNNRPSFSEIITILNLMRAKIDVAKIRNIQEEFVDTETQDIPKMDPFSSPVK